MTRRAVSVMGIAGALLGCTSIDPGPALVVPNATFDPDYFYCHVEPQFIFAANYQCGSGKPGDNSQCHFSSAVTGMALVAHPPINCGGGDHPVDITQITSDAQGDYSAVSTEMSADWMNSPLYVRPLGNTHPRTIFTTSDQNVINVLSKWASLQ